MSAGTMLGERSSYYRNYMLTMLMVIFAFNNVDRLAFGLVLQDIKADLQLSDTQLGVLSGIAFAFFYSVMGIPLARWADKGNRVVIIALTTALWSATAALMGLANSFIFLLIVRIGIAVGEAGCKPIAHSLIPDYFSRRERPRAVSRFMLGGPLAAVIGYFLAGWLNQAYGWRMTFIVLGLPGLALAGVAWATLREPRLRSGRELSVPGHQSDSPVVVSVQQVIKTLWANQTFRHLMLCFVIIVFFTAGISKWKPAFFIRSFGMQTGELGTWFALIYGGVGLLGTYLGGELASRYASNNEPLQLKAIALAYASFGVLSAFIYLSNDKYVAFGLLAISTLGNTMALGPMFALTQTLVPERMRAMAIAVLYLFANLIGLGLGPLAAGMLSDALRPDVGEESLRYALLILCPGYFWGAWYVLQASRTVSADLPDLEK